MLKRITDMTSTDELIGNHTVDRIDIVRECRRDFKNRFVLYNKEVLKVATVYWNLTLNELVLVVKKHGDDNDYCDIITEFDVTFPSLGYTNYFRGRFKTAIFVSRKPTRQWCKGFSKAVVSIKFPYQTFFAENLSIHLQDYTSIDDVIMRGCVHFPDYLKLSSAIAELSSRNSTALSVALSRDYALALHPLTGSLKLLFRGDLEAATLNLNDGSLISIEENAFWLESSIMEVLHA